MSYYNRDYKKLKVDDMEYLNRGQCAKILYNEKMILKKYYSDTSIVFRLKEKLFDIFKSINNPHFIELYDIYSDFNFIGLLKNKIGISSFNVDAYTAKYYSDNSLNVLFENKDYILDNFKELETLFEVFSENGICTDDVKRDNAVIGKDGIIIIDPDLFYTMESTKETILKINKNNLLQLYKSILINSSACEDNHANIVKFINNELVNINVTSNVDVTYEISKKLRYIKKPIDFFRK